MTRGYLELHDDPKEEEFKGFSASTSPSSSSSSPSRSRVPSGNNNNGSKEHAGVEMDDLMLTNPQTGLTHEQAAQRLKTFGPNQLVEVKVNQLLKFLSYFVGPIAFLIEAACIVSAIVKDWFNFFTILGLLFLNAIIGYFEEARAESAVEALRQTLALKTRCWREGQLQEIDTTLLVPGDIIVLRLGDIVPADGRLLGIDASGAHTDGELLVDQSSLTGESFAVSKKKGEEVYSSTVVKQGQQRAIVTKTGSETYIGKAAHLIANTASEGHFQKVINRIGNFLVLFTLVLTIIIIVVQYITYRNDPIRGQVLNILGPVMILAISAIPIGLPSVMAVTMAVGARGLAAKQVIVKRLAAVEEMSALSVLCSDKTGTLTLNELTFDEPYLAQGYSPQDLLLYSYLASEFGANDPIELAVRQAAEWQVPILRNRPAGSSKVPGYEISNFIPFNPSSKYTQATVRDGAPQVIIQLVGGSDEAVRAYTTMAQRGLRALGVARTLAGTDKWTLVGLAAMLDPPRPDSEQTIQRCQKMGITVKMVTGDQQIIAKEVSRRLGLGRVILDASHLADGSLSEEQRSERFYRADGFAEVTPEHKFRIVDALQQRGLLVGDGVNDAPALKKANVGIAVHGCTDAARSAADIVLLAPGLSTIVDGILASRAIFQRMRSYALYRITSTVHFLMFFFVVILVFDWTLPAKLLILICVLNDLATLVIAVDNAQISKMPDKWRVGQLIFLSCFLGVLLTGLSFGHFFYFWKVHGYNPYPTAEVNSPEVDRSLESIMYLHISSAPHFLIFSTRLTGYFWGEHANHSGPRSLWYLLVSCVVLDVIKVQVFKFWTLALTPSPVHPCGGRRKMLQDRKRVEVSREADLEEYA
ncbi:LOW QUALITY PROTEIN: plasma-membrane proton-efflux P-type ATPase [Linnemannia elongata]|nr:LOW QUALITY PROTEIN: plasma-membrane proton-efflux P-type ATPase [Linnemannia elongata]